MEEAEGVVFLRTNIAGLISLKDFPLSDQLASVLPATRLTLIGTEQSLPASTTYVFLRIAEALSQMDCTYGRLIYSLDSLTLDATIPSHDLLGGKAQQSWVNNFRRC